MLSFLFRHASQQPEAPALWVDSHWIDWRTLAATVVANARRLQAQHPRVSGRSADSPGNRVVTTFANDATAVIGALTLQALQLVEVPVGDQAVGDVADRRASQTGAVAIWDASQIDTTLTAADDRELVFDWQPPADAAEQLILWTSGTTAEPRGVSLSGGALRANAAGKLAAAPQTADDRRLTVLPLWHSYARTCDLGTWLQSGCGLAVTLGWSGLAELAPHTAPTLLNVVPRLAVRLLDADDNPLRERLTKLGLGQLRMLGCGGAPLAANDFLALQDAGLCVIHGYGLTEAGPVVCSASPATTRPGCVGRPILDTEIQIAADGRLAVRGPGLMTGYVNDPLATAEKIKAGWLQTGDLAEQDDDGIVRILGRADDTLVLPDGHKLQPLEIEQRLERSPRVRHAVLWQDRVGQVVAIIDADAASRADLQAALLALFNNRPRWQIPSRWVFLDRPLSADELTQKGTAKRAIVGTRYADR